MWFSESTSNLLGAWLGASIGIFGGTFGSFAVAFANKGKFKKLIFSVLAFLIPLGLICLAVALYALLRGQPFHVLYPFALIGIILSSISISQWFLCRKIYEMVQLRKMSVKDLD